MSDGWSESFVRSPHFSTRSVLEESDGKDGFKFAHDAERTRIGSVMSIPEGSEGCDVKPQAASAPAVEDRSET